ncbi:MAG: HAD family hydrolase [Spirochaetales bacterium]|nr:HAD family hydrolase [Spirochaetales bacterium]
MNMAVKAVAFDIDGTLYPNWKMQLNSIPFFAFHPVLIYRFGEIRKEIRNHQNIEDFYTIQARLLGEVLHISTERAKDIIDDIFYTRWERTFSRIKPYGNVKMVIESIRAMGLKTAVLSDFPVGRKLEYFGLENLWDVELSSEETGYLKPHKRPFEVLSEKLGLSPKEVIYVGNSYSYDVKGSKGAGMISGHLSSSERDGTIADFTFGSYSDFMDKIRRFL